MANEIKTTLHPMGDTGTNLYPNIKSDNIPDNLEFNNAQVPSSNNLKPYLLLEDNDGKVYKSLYTIAFNNFNIPSKIENNTFSGVNTYNNTTYFNGSTFHEETATFEDVIINGEFTINGTTTFEDDVTMGNVTQTGNSTINGNVTISDTGLFRNYAETQIRGSLYLGSDAKQTLVNLIYPVGSIYMSVNDVSPATLFGGTWVKLEDRFLLGSGTYINGSTGGNTTHNHTLDNGYAQIDLSDRVLMNSKSQNIPINTASGTFSSRESVAWSTEHAVELGGSTDNANNMPPYLVVNMWKRTA